ncbi:MAG: regulatory iron-sulfur-containing complex subunit RicT [Bacteriovoracaceae bacterium]|nr:regulatory iron-sulfur-containing complex subunit RicT [Bacteriovoracaceae bacterium]
MNNNNTNNGNNNNQNTLLENNHDDQNDSQNRGQQNQNEGQRFQNGQLLTFVKVRFPGNAKSFAFLIGKRKIAYGQKVVAMSDRGMAVGYVNSFPYQIPYHSDMGPIKSISKVATDRDLELQREHYKKEKEFESRCKIYIEKHALDMNLTHVEFTHFGKKCVFYFTAPARIDFRYLVRDLVNDLKIRIELRQISVRDRAAAIGGIGPCGLQLCCSSFLTKYGSVGVKMAKNQDLTLNFSKLNGVCGQLKCCLSYEDDVYSQKRSILPPVGEYIKLINGEFGRVEKIQILEEVFDMITEQGVRKRYVGAYFKSLAPDDFRMPDFEHISDETSIIVGLEELKQKEIKHREDEKIKIMNEKTDYAEHVFQNLFGQQSLKEIFVN